MKRLARFLLDTLTALSLLLAIATAGLWVRSYRRTDAIVYAGPSGHAAVQCATGQILLGKDNVGAPSRSFGIDSWPVTSDLTLGLSGGSWTRWGFMADLGTSSGGVRSDRVAVPLWLLLFLYSLLPIIRAPACLRSRFRRRHRLCQACGYDMRANPAKCSECGREADGS